MLPRRIALAALAVAAAPLVSCTTDSGAAAAEALGPGIERDVDDLVGEYGFEEFVRPRGVPSRVLGFRAEVNAELDLRRGELALAVNSDDEAALSHSLRAAVDDLGEYRFDDATRTAGDVPDELRPHVGDGTGFVAMSTAGRARRWDVSVFPHPEAPSAHVVVVRLLEPGFDGPYTAPGSVTAETDELIDATSTARYATAGWGYELSAAGTGDDGAVERFRHTFSIPAEQHVAAADRLTDVVDEHARGDTASYTTFEAAGAEWLIDGRGVSSATRSLTQS